MPSIARSVPVVPKGCSVVRAQTGFSPSSDTLKACRPWLARPRLFPKKCSVARARTGSTPSSDTLKACRPWLARRRPSWPSTVRGGSRPSSRPCTAGNSTSRACHSREGGNPENVDWIPAFAGMTAKFQLNEPDLTSEAWGSTCRVRGVPGGGPGPSAAMDGRSRASHGRHAFSASRTAPGCRTHVFKAPRHTALILLSGR